MDYDSNLICLYFNSAISNCHKYSISKVSYSLDTNLLSSFDVGQKKIEDIINE